MRKYFAILVYALFVLLGLKFCAQLLNYNDSVLFILSIFIYIIFIFSIILVAPALLFKSSLRNINSLKTWVLSILLCFFLGYVDSILYEDWNLALKNESESEIHLNVSHLSSVYGYNITIPAKSKRHVYVPIHKLKNSEVNVCDSEKRCIYVNMNCRGFGGCTRDSCRVVSHSETRYPEYCGRKKWYEL